MGRKEDDANMLRLSTPQSLPAKTQEITIANLAPSAPPGQPDDVHLTKVRAAISEFMGIYWGSVEVTEMIQKLKERRTRVDKVQLYWIVREDPHCTFVPDGSNE